MFHALGSLFWQCASFFFFLIFEISSALSGRLCGLSHATHWWRYVLITFTSFKHRALYWNCFYYYAQFYFRCLIQLSPALEKPKTTPNNLQNVLEIIGKREKGDESRVTAHWLIFELASYGSGSLALLFTKVITWPRLCCDPITVVSTHDACVHHFSHHVPHATRQIATFCNMRRGLFNSFNNCPIEWPFPASPALTSLIPAGGLKANCTSPRFFLFPTLSLSRSLPLSSCSLWQATKYCPKYAKSLVLSAASTHISTAKTPYQTTSYYRYMIYVVYHANFFIFNSSFWQLRCGNSMRQ